MVWFGNLFVMVSSRRNATERAKHYEAAIELQISPSSVDASPSAHCGAAPRNARLEVGDQQLREDFICL